MVRVEVSPFGLEFFLFADEDDRLSQTLRVTRLPIGSRVVVRKVGNEECRIPDLGAYDVVDNSGA